MWSRKEGSTIFGCWALEAQIHIKLAQKFNKAPELETGMFGLKFINDSTDDHSKLLQNFLKCWNLSNELSHVRFGQQEAKLYLKGVFSKKGSQSSP